MTQFSEQLQRPYDALASLLNCAPSNIAILQSATSAWAQVHDYRSSSPFSKHCTTTGFSFHSCWIQYVVLWQVFYGIPLTAGDRILTSIIEYGANYIAFLQVRLQTCSESSTLLIEQLFFMAFYRWTREMCNHGLCRPIIVFVV